MRDLLGVHVTGADRPQFRLTVDPRRAGTPKDMASCCHDPNCRIPGFFVWNDYLLHRIDFIKFRSSTSDVVWPAARLDFG